MSQSTMLQAALIGTTPESLSAINPTLPGATLTPIDEFAALEVTLENPGVSAYATRDRELLYRDLVAASYVAQLAVQISTVWNCDVTWSALPVIPDSSFGFSSTDFPNYGTPSTPGTVNHVQNSQLPINAEAVDRQLYARDAVIVESLARMSFIFPETSRVITPLDSNITVDDSWSRASGSDTYNDISASSPYSRATFLASDQYLAGRDNNVAAQAATLNQFLINIFEGADRLVLRVSSTATTIPA